MPAGVDSTTEKKKQKKLHLQKLKTLQKMCGEALKDFECCKNIMEGSVSEVDRSLLQSKINVVKRILCEMQEVSKSIGKGGYFVGNFYLRKHSMMETSRRKGLQRYYITEIPETYIRELSPTSEHPGLSLFQNDSNNSYVGNIHYNPHTPHQPNIQSLDDFEDDFDEVPPSESPFDKLETLMKHPAHISVFFHYLISNSNPSAFCLLYITSDLKQREKSSGLIQHLYSLYCTFLQESATMKIEVRKEIVEEVRILLESEKPDKKREDILRVLRTIHQHCVPLVQTLLDDFKFKRLLGLGSLFGDKDLRNNMDSYARNLVIEKSLWPHFEEYMKDTWNSYSLCLASCIATFFKMFGFSPQTSLGSKKLELCPIFRQKNKSSFSQGTFPYQSSKDKICLMKDHYFVAQRYSSEQNCHLCGRLVCSVGDYGLSCTDCHKHYHKACANQLEFTCEIVRKKKQKTSKGETTRISGIPGSGKPHEMKFVTNKQLKTIEHLVNVPIGQQDGFDVAPGSPVSSSILPLDLGPTIGSFSSVCPFPDADLIEEVSLRETLCLNNTLDKKEFKKKSAIEELVTSETVHVRSLKILHNVHYIPMLQKFPHDFVTLIFPNLHEVISIHDDLKNDFKALINERNVDYISRISEILLKHFSGERGTMCKEIFGAFIEKQSYAIKVLKVRQANDPELDNFIKHKMNHPLCHRLSLQDLLSKVMQRISKYPMLIRNLIHLAQDCPPSILDTLENVLWHVDKITSYVNRTVHDFETNLKLHSLQKRMIVKPVDRVNNNMPYLDIYKSLDLRQHQLLFEGPLKWQVNGMFSMSMHVILLEEMIILLQQQQQQSNQLFETLTRPLNQRATHSLILSYHSTLITEGKENTRTTHSPIILLSDLIFKPVANDKRSLFLISTSNHGPQIYSLSADTPQEINQWLKYLTKATQTLKDKKYKASFYFGIESKRQKLNQKKTIVPSDTVSDVENVSLAKNGRGCEISRELSLDLSEWGSIMRGMDQRISVDSTPVLCIGSKNEKISDSEDSVFQSSPISNLRLAAKSVDNLMNGEISGTTSSEAIYSMYLEFNNFIEALGIFLAENSSSSRVTSMSPKQLQEWSNHLHIKFKDVLEVFNKSSCQNCDRPLQRSFSDEGTSA